MLCFWHHLGMLIFEKAFSAFNEQGIKFWWSRPCLYECCSSIFKNYVTRKKHLLFQYLKKKVYYIRFPAHSFVVGKPDFPHLCNLHKSVFIFSGLTTVAYLKCSWVTTVRNWSDPSWSVPQSSAFSHRARNLVTFTPLGKLPFTEHVITNTLIYSISLFSALSCTI